MGFTQIQKILAAHGAEDASPGSIVDIWIDARVARDFGGANVVKNLRDNGLGIHDPKKTFFTFDCNPGGSDQKYATNQQICRMFAREHGIKIYDIDSGIGTHIAIDEGLVGPGGTLVSTDSHANILGAIGAFGQGMGDLDVAQSFAEGKTWFKVPLSMKIVLKGKPSPDATAKDIVLSMAQVLGANGLLGYSAEIVGDMVETMSLADRITISSMVTEMGGIIGLFQPSREMVEQAKNRGIDVPDTTPDPDALYDKEVEIDIEGLGPMVARPGHPEDVVSVSEVKGRKIDSVFIGSCTNGRYEDMVAAANILEGRKVAPGVVLKIVPSTRGVWDRCLREGLLTIMTDAGALIGNPGCAGCAAGQIGQNGPGEVVVSTGNRNFPGKQGKGEVYLASPQTAAASAIAGVLTTAKEIPDKPVLFEKKASGAAAPVKTEAPCSAPLKVHGRAWVIDKDNIDTDMIFHNRYLTITDIAQMGQYAFDNLEGFQDFAKKAKPGDIVITGKNFGCGSSRQQAVDCFKSLGISLIIAESFGAIYERNAVNAGMPIMNGKMDGLENGDELEVDMETGLVKNITRGTEHGISPFSPVQIDIYRRGGLLAGGCK
ncbi:MAG: aconitase/3-isopropylmalate dehydratase large subunit family protein [Candidatus Thermoplasmatota archaeon]|nr:aconitase/3-isopropylmalate dehydratase large subunit family protein [Candidatus Thermoplasmatota archaeon]